MKRNRYSKNTSLELHQLKGYLSQVKALGGSDALVEALNERIDVLQRALDQRAEAGDQTAA